MLLTYVVLMITEIISSNRISIYLCFRFWQMLDKCFCYC